MIRLYPYLVLLLFGTVLGFSACGEDDDVPTLPVIGTIADNLQDDPQFSTLVAALERTGQAGFVDGATARLTVFAPTNEAFTAAGIDLASLSDDELSDILAYHILVGQVLRDGDIAEGRSEFNTRNATGPTNVNLPVTIDNSGGTLTLDGEVNVTDGPNETVNGVYYAIDNVLMPPTIVDRAVLNGSFTTLITALERVGLDEVLADTGDYTVFAPTDAAFTASGINLATVSDGDLRNLLLYHVLGTGIPAANIPAGQSFQTTLSAGSEDVSESMLSLLITNNDSVTINGDAMVVAADVYASNGVVHAIDNVLEMQSIADFLTKAGALDSLEAAVMAADLDDDLGDDNGPFTVFAPVNAAFTAASDTIATLSMDQLVNVLLYHVASGNIRSEELMDDMVVNTLNAGQNFSINMEEDEAPVIITSDSTEVNFIMTDIQATNGVVHLVDGVLLPELEE
ncbi:putative surface protein with fasciclin (FAS1) repeats [Neolewinella xylanilytica]|uniref:Putative surface protein with fasciclin (FAS1) repeats n=1 Tax=Neolewinella xylanilytica TaxID=1514080 RepID=A0A2S6I0X3_9BACT|nr:fasciclin domain-containing protein [Neolewinella xylanilytica]PPK84618.1 putative surface protein with fasciclin (FAS1) repeats [Neolewinella xylanilytica]